MWRKKAEEYQKKMYKDDVKAIYLVDKLLVKSNPNDGMTKGSC